jgi:hypothetical protein
MRGTSRLVAVVLGVLALSSMSSLAGASSTPGAGGRGSEKSGGVVEITAYSSNDGPSSTAVVTGAIADFGTAVRTSANGAGAQQYNRLDLKVSRGSFALDITALEERLVTAFALFPTNLKTCSGVEVVKASAPVATGSGTGAYKGISGSFDLVVTINEVDTWPTCPRTGQNLLTESIFVTGSGTVSFRS